MYKIECGRKQMWKMAYLKNSDNNRVNMCY